MSNVPYLYSKSACIYSRYLTVSELLVGQASKYNACAMDMILDELRSNNIEIDKETLSFLIDACLREHEEIYGAVINQLDKDNLTTSLYDIYKEMNPNNFGRMMIYLTIVYKINDIMDKEAIREAIRKTVEDFKRIDLRMRHGYDLGRT